MEHFNTTIIVSVAAGIILAEAFKGILGTLLGVTLIAGIKTWFGLTATANPDGSKRRAVVRLPR